MPYLSDYKAILFDVDRTLIPPTREIFPEVIEMLKSLNEKGIITGICTGRGYASVVNKFMPIFPENSIHIMAGGSLIISNTGKIIWQKTIDQKTTAELRELVIQTGSVGIFMKPDAQYAFNDVLEGIRNHPWNQIGKDLNDMSSDGVNLVYIAQPNEQITAFLSDHPMLSFKELRSNQGYPYYDITARGVTKALAMEEWAKITGIPTSKIIGFGDSLNDLEFLQNCGFSVAMGNAEFEIKEIANRTIGNVADKSLPNYVQNILEGEALWKLQCLIQEKKLAN